MRDDSGGSPGDLQHVTRSLSLRVIRFVKTLRRDQVSNVIGRQLLKSGTSVGANYRSACRARSRGDFIHKMSIARKEARESRYWLRLISAAIRNDDTVQILVQESGELVRILSAIVATAKKKL